MVIVTSAITEDVMFTVLDFVSLHCLPGMLLIPDLVGLPDATPHGKTLHRESVVL